VSSNALAIVKVIGKPNINIITTKRKVKRNNKTFESAVAHRDN